MKIFSDVFKFCINHFLWAYFRRALSLFSTNLLAKLLSDSLLSDSSISLSHSKL